MRKYTKTHEWIESESATIVKVGITDHAQNELRDIVFVELPKLQSEVTQGVASAVVESVKAAFDIYAPVSGKVIEVNQAIEEDPALVNKDPHGAGWFYKVQMKDASELDNLLDEDAYNSLLQGGK